MKTRVQVAGGTLLAIAIMWEIAVMSGPGNVALWPPAVLGVVGLVGLYLGQFYSDNAPKIQPSWIATGIIGLLVVWCAVDYGMKSVDNLVPAAKWTGYLIVTKDPSALCPVSEQAYAEFCRHLVNHDDKAILEMGRHVQILAVKKGTRCEYKEGAMGYRKVRIVDGTLAGRDVLLLDDDFVEERK